MVLEKSVSEQVTCFHCGEELPSDPITFDGKSFCCLGCRTVYEVLSSNNLGEYYGINQTPGTRQSDVRDKDLGFLNDPSIKSRFIRYSDDQMSIGQFYIPAMHCSSCIWLLENLYKLHNGIFESTVNFGDKMLTVKFDHTQLSLADLVRLLRKIGYQPNLSLSDEKSGGDKEYSYGLYKKLGVAGFSFGNIMLLSFPEYLGFGGNDPLLQSTFRVLIFILALPVLLYSSTDYFRSAIAAVRERGINIDVPLTLGIIALFGRSTYDLFWTASPGYMDSFAGLLFFLLIGKLFQHKTFESLNFDRTYQSYFPLSVSVEGIDEEVTIPIGSVKPGDTIIIHNQEIIPADGILTEGEALIDYSFVTGESSPVEIKAGELIYAGGRQTGGIIKLSVVQKTSESYLTRLWNNSSDAKKQHSTYSDFSNVVSKYFTFAILLLAFGASAYHAMTSLEMAMNVFTAVLIIACPCALALSTPFTFGSAQRLLARAGFYVRNPIIIETMSKINAIVFDKTGTLTGLQSLEVRYTGDELTIPEKEAAASLFRESVHPLSRRLYLHLRDEITKTAGVNKFSEITGYGIEGYIDGKILKAGSAKFLERENPLQISEKAKDIPGNKVYIAIDQKVRGCFIVSSVVRDGVKDMIADAAASNDVFLLSGDTAKQDSSLLRLFSDEKKTHFGKTPFEKLEFVKELKKQGKTVLMVGDGLNDSGAVGAADVGVSVSDDITGFTPAGDGILTGERVRDTGKFLRFTKDSMTIIKISFTVSALYNITGLTYAVSGQLTPLFAAILMPVSSLTVIVITSLGSLFFARKRGIA